MAQYMVDHLPLNASLIISVYKNTVFLKAVLNSLSRQTYQQFEIIISEDGQSPEMAEFIGAYPFKHNYHHITQEDLGWRKNKILNQAVRTAKTNWLIFIDGDCVLHHRFIESHIKHSHPQRILAGKRIILDPETSGLILQNRIHDNELNPYFLKNFRKIKKRGGRFVEEGIFIDPRGGWGWISRIRRMRHLKGCNMSFHKEAIYAINGFDEDFTKPAVGEDADLLWRFAQAGYQLSSVRNLAVQYHLYHKVIWTDQEENLQLMEAKQSRNEFFCKHGLNNIQE
jgi:GT2 family glycosyltransferase